MSDSPVSNITCEEQQKQLDQQQREYIGWLLECICQHNVEGVRRLLDEYGFLDFINPNGLRPAHYAAYCQTPDILDLLIHAGANVNQYCPMETSVLQFAVMSYPTNQEASCRMVSSLLAPVLVSQGTSDECEGAEQYVRRRVTDRDILGEALQVAAGEAYTSLVPMLLEGGADPNYFSPSDEFCMTPVVGMIFENTVLEGHAEILGLLLDGGLDLQHTSNEWTAGEYAQHNGREDLLPLLLSSPNAASPSLT